MLDALRRGVHDGGLWQEDHGFPYGGHHPLILRQIQYSLQPANLRVHEQEGLSLNNFPLHQKKTVHPHL